METKYIIAIAVAAVVLLLISLLTANRKLMRLFKKYDQVIAKSGFSTQQFLIAARDTLGVDKLTFARIKGKLTDCYIPSKRVIALSDSTYDKRSVAAISVAAHEFGHALQHKNSPVSFTIIRALGFISRVFNKFVLPAVIAAVVMLIFETTRNTAIIMLWSALAVVVAGFLFRIFTIPLEYDASRRAKEVLAKYHVFDQEEQRIAKKILASAAYTYVAEFISSIIGLNFIRRRIIHK